jgi:hypothetical protein
MMKEPIIESFRRWLEEEPTRKFNEAEVKIMLDRIGYLEGKVEELEADRDLMICKFDEDFENAIDFHLEKEAKKRRDNKCEEEE